MRFFAFFIAMVCLTPLSLKSQTGSIQGRIIDLATNDFIVGAQVVLTDGKYQCLSNTTGQYVFANLEPGTYVLQIEYLGFENYKEEIVVKEGEKKVIHHQLKPVPFELESVEVSADPEAHQEIIAAVDVSLRTINTSQEVLRLVPGLFIAQHAGGGKAEQIFLRGFDIDHGTDIAITTDGMPVNMVSHAHGQGYADLHYLIPETVDRVHFGKGPYHTHQGNMATAGYVGFQTMNHLEENMVSIQTGQFNTLRGLGLISLLKEGSQHQQQNAYIAGEYMRTDGYFESPQDFSRYSFFGKYNRSLGSNHYLTGSASVFSSKWDASGQIPLRAVQDGSIGFFGAVDDTEGGETSRSNANMQLTSTLSPNSYFKNQVFYTNYNFELYSNFTFFLKDSIHGDQIKQKENRNLLGYNGAYTRRDELKGIGLQTEIGLQYRKDFSNDNELSHTFSKTTILERLSYGNIQEGNIGVYLNETIDLSSKVTLNAGLRYDHFSFQYTDHLAGDEIKKATDQVFSPKLNAYVQLSDQIQLVGNIGYGFHSNDTRVVVAQKSVETLPRALGIDIGAIWKPIPRLLLAGTIWHLDLDQEFVYVGDEAIVEPSGKTTRKGIEFSGRWQVLDWLYADVDLNLTAAITVDEPEGHNYIPLAPKFSSIGGFTIQTANQWNGSIRYKHLGDRPANENNTVIAEGYTIVDALFSKRIRQFEFGFAIENIFDVRWREAQFDTESRLKDELVPVSEIHFTAGTPFSLKVHANYYW
ncbi:MAG TPA: TonB-dependent receptor [Saprospiraceae bacterium]